MPGPINNFAQRTFQRVDANGNGSLSRGEIKEHLGNVGVGGGLFGGVIKNKAADAFVDQFDGNNDSRVSWQEFQGQAASLMPQGIRDADGRINRTLANRTFEGMDSNGNGSLSVSELQSTLRRELPRDTDHRSTVAEIGAKLGVDALDEDRNGSVSRTEFDGALNALDTLGQ